MGPHVGSRLRRGRNSHSSYQIRELGTRRETQPFNFRMLFPLSHQQEKERKALEGGSDEEDETQAKLSKKKLKKLNRLTCVRVCMCVCTVGGLVGWVGGRVCAFV